jgi:hypothetical protein
MGGEGLFFFETVQPVSFALGVMSGLDGLSAGKHATTKKHESRVKVLASVEK